MYCFVNWREAADEGKELDLPEDIDYGVLAEPYRNSDYVLAQITCSGEYQPAMPISEKLEDLLDAAEQYAPALAITRETLSRRKEPVERQEFERQLIERLRHLLSGQRDDPYFLALAIVSEGAYKSAGTYYWIVGYRPDRVGREINWVSRDYFIYQDSIAEFDVDVAFLEQTFPPRGT